MITCAPKAKSIAVSSSLTNADTASRAGASSFSVNFSCSSKSRHALIQL